MLGPACDSFLDLLFIPAGREGIVVLQLAAWWLSLSYLDAFLLEMGLIAFFLPYTYVYNLVYDKVRERLVRRSQAGRVSEA